MKLKSGLSQEDFTSALMQAVTMALDSKVGGTDGKSNASPSGGMMSNAYSSSIVNSNDSDENLEKFLEDTYEEDDESTEGWNLFADGGFSSGSVGEGGGFSSGDGEGDVFSGSRDNAFSSTVDSSGGGDVFSGSGEGVNPFETGGFGADSSSSSGTTVNRETRNPFETGGFSSGSGESGGFSSGGGESGNPFETGRFASEGSVNPFETGGFASGGSKNPFETGGFGTEPVRPASVPQNTGSINHERPLSSVHDTGNISQDIPNKPVSSETPVGVSDQPIVRSPINAVGGSSAPRQAQRKSIGVPDNSRRPSVEDSYDVDEILNSTQPLYDGSAPVHRLPSTREAIRENVDFFKKTAEEKFRSCDQGIQEVVKKFTVDHSYLDIVPGVAEMVRQRLRVYANKGVNDGAKKAFHKEKSDRHLKDNSLFTNNIANVAGNDVKYTRHVEIPQWSLDLHECLTDGDKANNFDQVRIKITEELVNYFGGFRRMQRIYVVSYQLIINDVCYVPRLSKQVLARLPFDCADYITNGNLAPFFDWSYIFKMNNLHLLSFDDMDFVTTYVADDIGMGRDFKPVLLFKHCKNLSTLCIGSDVIRYPLPEDEIENQQVQEAVEHMEYKAHQNTYFYDKCEKYYNATFNSTKAVRQWGVGNLVNYAQNRGDKGVLRYTGGLAVRTAVATGLAIPEAVTRVTGGLIGGIKSTLKSARQATSNQDITNNGGNM